MIGRFVALVVFAWLAGFVAFAVTLPRAAEPVVTDAVIVPTGLGGRIERGLEVLAEEQAQQMLVSGVDRAVRPVEFAEQFAVAPEVMQCCVTLGFYAVDTKTNAREAAEWIKQNDFKTVRLVTHDWHMRRALLDLKREVPESVEIVSDAVASQPSLRILVLEYHKLLADAVGGNVF